MSGHNNPEIDEVIAQSIRDSGIEDAFKYLDAQIAKEAGAKFEKKIAELEAENAVLKSRCTWKRALEVQPPLNKLVIVLKEFYGVSRSQFEIISGRLYFFKPGDLIGYEATDDTFWCEMPDFPEAQS